MGLKKKTHIKTMGFHIYMNIYIGSIHYLNMKVYIYGRVEINIDIKP